MTETEKLLYNGLTKWNGYEYIFEESNTFPLVNFGIIIKHGGAYDNPINEGLHHFVLKALTLGTKKRIREEIADDLEYLGSSFNVDVGYDYSIISGSTLTDNIELFFDIYSDILLNPSFDANEIEKLKREIISLIENQKNDDRYLGSRWFRKFLFGNHGYGNFIEGTVSSINSFSREQIVDYYNNLH